MSSLFNTPIGRTFPLWLIFLTITTTQSHSWSAEPRQDSSRKPLLIAHRGASAYAPEHTLAAYKLAIQQGADFVEQDLQVTKDGILICLHDPDLARTTDVEEIFPDRATTKDVIGDGKPRRGWYAADFTLAEIKKLDAGTWFNQANPFAARETYVGERIPTLIEAIDAIGDRAGLYIELKHYEFYKQNASRDMADNLVGVLNSKGYQHRTERIFIQSFWKSALLRLKEKAPGYRRVQLLPMDDPALRNGTDKITPVLARQIATYAQGAGPAKQMLKSPQEQALLREAGLIVHPYTFRGSTTAAARKPLDQKEPNGSTVAQNVVSEIRTYLGFGIDGGFTDYPDLWRQATGR
jgi:glycerophosphoryl diester phosphodiesterase